MKLLHQPLDLLHIATKQIDLFVDLIQRNLAGWVESKADWDPEQARSAAEQSKELAEAMIAKTNRG